MLTEEQKLQLTMQMRVLELIERNPDVVNTNAEFKKSGEELKKNVQKILDLLSEDQKDEILERYKIELNHLGLDRKQEKS